MVMNRRYEFECWVNVGCIESSTWIYKLDHVAQVIKLIKVISKIQDSTFVHSS